MKTNLSINNPFKNTMKLGHAFSWEIFSDFKQSGKDINVMDYGAYDGRMLNQFVKDKIIDKAISVDLNKEVVESNKTLFLQAKEIGLVDELGGFLKAFSVAKQLLNIPEESHVEIVMMEEPSFIGSFFDDFFGGVELISSLTNQVRTIMQGQTTVESKLGFIPH